MAISSGHQDHHYTFLWGYVKDRVYADKLSTLKHLKINIRQVMAEIPINMCQKLVENYLKRINNACKTSRGCKSMKNRIFSTYAL